LRHTNLRALLRVRNFRLDALGGFRYHRVCFGDRDRIEPPADLTDASFPDCAFDEASFAHTPLIDVSFRGCDFTGCDFRYAHIRGANFQDADFAGCDFYSAFFEAANIFSLVRLNRVSFDHAWLNGVLGLEMSDLTRRAHAECPLVQECDVESYIQFLQPTMTDRPDASTITDAAASAKLTAAETYRTLSAVWTTQGQYSDAAAAYLRRRNLERDFYSPLRKRSQKMLELTGKRQTKLNWLSARWLGLVVAWALANYGVSMKRVAGWLMALILVPGVAFSVLGGVETTGDHPQSVRELPRCLLFSLEQLTASVSRLQGSSSLVDLVGALQVFVGVALLGLFGFTLASWLRNG
jgi:hypothetical protein